MHIPTTRREHDNNNNNNDVMMEKAMAPDQIPEGLDRNNLLVAASDVNAAVDAIHETFRAYEEDRFVVEGEDSDDDLEAIRDVHKRMLRDRARQMVKSLHRVSHTISDAEYNSFVRAYCDEYDPPGVSMGEGGDNDMDDEENTRENARGGGDDDEVGEMVDEFDAEELVDPAAKKKVDGLRKQVLERARLVQAKRDSVIQRATQVARDATQRLVVKNPMAPPSSTAPAESNMEELGPRCDKVQARVTALRESVAQVKEQLVTSEQQLEQQLDKLKSTVAVIEKNQNPGGNNPTRKIDELMRTNFRAPSRAPLNDENVMVDPAERLAEFLRH